MLLRFGWETITGGYDSEAIFSYENFLDWMFPILLITKVRFKDAISSEAPIIEWHVQFKFGNLTYLIKDEYFIYIAI